MHRKLITALLVFPMLIMANSFVYAKNLGKIGQTYPIKEMDMLDFIQTRLKQMQQGGELEKINKQMIETAKTRSDRPTPVKGISSTKTYRKWFIDPSITIKNDIIEAQGKIVVKAGTMVNPLRVTSLKSTFIFYDGDNKAQVVWAKEQDKLFKGRTKLILIKGSVVEQINIFKKKVLFDQRGELINKFKIQHTPALASQEGLQIKVEEVVL
jgi:conjugal transfer pilus assembly protein TraW